MLTKWSEMPIFVFNVVNANY